MEDPGRISSKQEKQVKKYVKDFFDKAVAKRREHEQKKAEKKSKEAAAAAPTPGITQTPVKNPEPILEGDEEIVLSENEIEDDDDEPSPVDTNISPAEELKRKREADDTPLTSISDTEQGAPTKKLRSQTPPPPPPPPPPPVDGVHDEEADMGMDGPHPEEAGLTPGEDISGSFTNEALEAVSIGKTGRHPLWDRELTTSLSGVKREVST